MNIIIAQGAAYYGSAFCTTSIGLKEAHARLTKAGYPARLVLSAGPGSETIMVTEVFDPLKPGQPEHAREYTVIMIRPWAGEPQPEPIIYFDSGHGQRDLEALTAVKIALTSA